jgi:hypothetical protein
MQTVSDAIYSEIMAGLPDRKFGSSGLCVRGHRLESPNLTGVSVRRGYRACKACNKAHTSCNRSGGHSNIQEVSDRYYAKIMDAYTPSVVADDRHPACIEQWPDCRNGDYDPRCCRFPKSCSC